MKSLLGFHVTTVATYLIQKKAAAFMKMCTASRNQQESLRGRVTTGVTTGLTTVATRIIVAENVKRVIVTLAANRRITCYAGLASLRRAADLRTSKIWTDGTN